MPSVLVTGGNRGIGLEFVKQYTEKGWRVFATCRDPQSAEELKKLADQNGSRVSVHAMDVAHHGQIETLAHELSSEPIDLLINNAGIYPGRGNHFQEVDYDDWAEAFRINCMAPLKVASCFVDHVQKSDKKMIATLSSKVGSLADNSSGGRYIYRSSKSAVNMAMKSLSIDLKNSDITVLIMHPGWVQTDMGGSNALIDTKASVEGMRRVFDSASIEQSGRFFAYDGQEIPW